MAETPQRRRADDSITLGPWLLGIDQLLPETRLPDGAVHDAVNGDFDSAGQFVRRAGLRRLLREPNLHSLYTSPVLGASFAVRGQQLCRVTYDGALAFAPLFDLGAPDPLSYCALDGQVIFGNRRLLGRINDLFQVARVGLETPGAPELLPRAAGGLLPGRYGIAVSVLAGEEESGLSAAAFIDLPGGGIQVNLLPVLDDTITRVRLYRTEPNGDVLYRAAEIPVVLTSYVLGALHVGRQADTRFLERMRPGRLVRAWRGRLLTAAGSVLYFSEPLRYGLYSPRDGFVPMGSRITLMEPVESGVYVGSREGVVFLAGNAPREWSLVRTGGKPPLPGTGSRIDASQLAPTLGVHGYCALWLSETGFVLGTDGGQLLEPQAARIKISPLPESGALVVHDRRALAILI